MQSWSPRLRMRIQVLDISLSGSGTSAWILTQNPVLQCLTVQSLSKTRGRRWKNEARDEQWCADLASSFFVISCLSEHASLPRNCTSKYCAAAEPPASA